jgi:hypothetical protein
MATHDPIKTACAELDKLTAAFNRAEAARVKAREELHEAIVKHLHARSAPPGKLSDHVPYDRNYVGQLGKAAGVRPLRGPNAGPAPAYQQEVKEAAYAELDQRSKVFEQRQAALEAARLRLHAAIGRHSDLIVPNRMAEHAPYDRNHVMRIVAEWRAEQAGA